MLNACDSSPQVNPKVLIFVLILSFNLFLVLSFKWIYFINLCNFKYLTVLRLVTGSGIAF